MGLVHRDDMPDELLDELQKQFPDMKIVCAGDLPADQLPDGVAEEAARIEEMCRSSMISGQCVDCGAFMPNYPATAEGWHYMVAIGNDDLMAWQCPICDAEDVGREDD